jgi:rRNA-processing protein FCF1
MTGSPSQLIVDANVLIDLHMGGLLRDLLKLPYAFAAPDVIIGEMQVPDGSLLTGYGLHSLEATGQEVREVAALAAEHRNVAANDLFALVLARSRKATLLTGDGRLRRLAEQTGIPVHGTLWALDEMVRTSVVTAPQAAVALSAMLAGGSRLPHDECQKRLRRWGVT